jgi:hypothetical protein
MGTRSLVHFHEDGQVIATLYGQWDGYPTGMGADLKEILDGRPVVNGITTDREAARAFNGMGCLTAQVIGGLKQGIGSIYVFPAGASDCGEEYVYRLIAKDSTVYISVETNEGMLFCGPVSEFDPEMVEATERELLESDEEREQEAIALFHQGA